MVGCLATVDDGAPDARMVLIRGVDERGLHFFTSTTSAKARQLAVTPRACLVFWWEPQMRQARVRGAVTRLPDDEADAGFAQLDRSSQIAARASDQYAVLEGRAELEARFEEARQGMRAPAVRPPGWGGFLLSPDEVELWQGHPDDRMHDRLRFLRDGDSWVCRRLAP
jgi:pyridoxamine 5'-phosphate oxidase